MNAKSIIPIEDAVSVRKISSGKEFHFTDFSNKYIFIIKKGLVKINLVGSDGKDAIKCILKPGDIFGEKSLLCLPVEHDEYAMALVDSVVALVDAESIRDKMHKDKGFRSLIYKEIGARIKKLEDKVLSMMYKELKERVYDLLIELALNFGTQTQEGFILNNFLTHEDLGNLVSSSRQSITGVMSEFRRQGIIDYNTRILKIYTRKGQSAVA